MATPVVFLDGTGITLTGDSPQSYCAGIENLQRGNRVMTIRATWAFNGQTKTILGNWRRL